MTGVEAVSNCVDGFREPRVNNARWTLAIIVVILGILLGGIAYLATSYGIMAMDQTQPGYQSVLSQLVGAVAGRGSVLLRGDRQRARHSLPVREYQLRRFSADVPAGGAG